VWGNDARRAQSYYLWEVAGLGCGGHTQNGSLMHVHSDMLSLLTHLCLPTQLATFIHACIKLIHGLLLGYPFFNALD
jgi:hypothetical protein